MSDQGQLDLRILGFDPGDEIAGARKIMLRTSRGEIPLVMHAAQSPARAVLCVSGAIGGFDGPAMLYPRLGLELPAADFGVLRLNYRKPNDFDECLIDALAALTFLKGVGYNRVAIIGHSFGGAIAINAGTLSDSVTTVVAVSSQLAGAHVVANLKPRPLLLLHGTADTVLPDECSKLLYQRASEPKTLKLFDGAEHRLSEVREELFAIVRAWLLEKT
ncbi:MAG: alpha/beta hydrolase [Candidatus Binataceae bacterium]